MNITLIRHTAVDVPQGIIYGQSDVELASTFEQEAKEISDQLNETFDVVYSSPLKRCVQLAKKISTNILYDDRLKELNFGNWEGKLWKDIEQTREAKAWFNDYLQVKCPNGESYQDLIERIKSFINEILRNPYENICIVTHSGPIRAFISIINDTDSTKIFNQKFGVKWKTNIF